MKASEITEYALTVARQYFRNRHGYVNDRNVKITWFSYTAGNWKAMASVIDEPLYMELTFIKDENVVVIDEYIKANHVEKNVEEIHA